MFGKSVYYLLAFLVSIAVVASAVPKTFYKEHYNANNNTRLSHHLIVGARVKGDRLVLQQTVIKRPSSGSQIIYEQTYNVSKYERITQVRALDRETNGYGATPTLLKGGPGRSQVTLRFKSVRGFGINFVVHLYAKP